MMKSILVIGSLPEERRNEDGRFRSLCRTIGYTVIEMGFRLVNGGSNNESNVDKHAAEGAAEACQESEYDLDEYIRAYVREGEESHNIGMRLIEDGETSIKKRINLVRQADALIAVGGGDGTGNYMTLAQDLKNYRPTIPLPMFGGQARAFWQRQKTSVPEHFPEYIETRDFEELHRVVSTDDDIRALAKYTVMLAKRAFPDTNYVFAATPSGEEFSNILLAIDLALEDTEYGCVRWDKMEVTDRIDAEVERRIRKAKALIVDLTSLNANVFYEFGFARGQNVPVLTIAAEGTELPFDVFTYPTVFYRPMTVAARVNDDIRAFADILRNKVLEKIAG